MRHWITVALLIGVAAAAPADPLRVLATTPIVADVAAAIAGPDAQVESLLPKDADAHAFQPRPADAARIAKADLILLSGLGMETSLASLLSSADSGKQLVVSAGIQPRRMQAACPSCTEEGAHAHEGDPDPHVWMNPLNVAHWADRMAEALSARDPAHAENFRTRARDYLQKMEELDRWIRYEIEAVPGPKRSLVSDHESFGYFCDRYGFSHEVSVLPGFSTLAQPSARDLARLEDALRQQKVPVIFIGMTSSSSLPERVAQDVGVRIVKLYACTLSAADGPAPDYPSMMRHNVRAIVEALK